ncbi:MAG TPA: transcriptional regulator [Planctomycetaceae bacterium]|nr:transcriptional regulator [Planctomycetaceae bacterium]
MNVEQLRAKLAELCALPTETEWAEFKHNNDEPKMIGEYLSAISNAAALEGQPFGYIVWGIQDGTHNVVGTTFKPRQKKGQGNEDLEPWLNNLLAPRIDFRIFEFQTENGKDVVLFEIQAANTAPVAFSGRRFVRVGSHKKPLGEHPEKERRLWETVSGPAVDWSADVCESASLDDLDPEAITLARTEYANKHANDPRKEQLVKEVWEWDDETFLNKAKVCIGGKVTRTAILLLGKPESTHHLSPSVAQITWILKDNDGLEVDYQHFEPPFLSAVDDLFAKVRNLTVRHLPDGTLFPVEVSQYDPWVLRETLHNCIAHQDYTCGGRINVVEQGDSLLFTNLGKFIPGSVEEVITRDAPQEFYANPFLARAMVNLNMIDTIGSGIKRAFTLQRRRNFPLPTYDLSEEGRVQVRVIGRILDANYTRMLMAQTELSLMDVVALDKVQKQVAITDEEAKSLRSKNLIEGRRPNVHVSADVAKATDTMVDYLKKRGIDKDYCVKMVKDLLQQQGQAKRAEIDSLLKEKLSDALNEQQKKDFITNLLQKLRRDGEIEVYGKGQAAYWELSNDG